MAMLEVKDLKVNYGMILDKSQYVFGLLGREVRDDRMF